MPLNIYACEIYVQGNALAAENASLTEKVLDQSVLSFIEKSSIFM